MKAGGGASVVAELVTLWGVEGVLGVRGGVGGRKGSVGVRGSTARPEKPAINELVYSVGEEGAPRGLVTMQVPKKTS